MVSTGNGEGTGSNMSHFVDCETLNGSTLKNHESCKFQHLERDY